MEVNYKQMKYKFFLLAGFFVSVMITSCSNTEDGGLEPPITKTYDIQGKVEKGPFVSGSEISIQPMNAQLQVLGSLYNTYITDDLGNFILGNKEFSTPYAEFMANGYFFNEVEGQLSNGTLTLRALADLNDNTTINVNILTHLKYARIKNLVSSGKQFKDANTQAQQELLNAFGLSSYSNKDVSSFSIIAGTDESAALVAISSMLLMNRTEAALTEYLSKLSADFGKNGYFSEDIQEQMTSDKNKLAKYLSDIKNNVIDRYENLGITINIKELSHFVDWDNDGIAGNEILKDNEFIEIDKSTIEIPNEGGVFSVNIKSPISIYLEPQVEDVPNNNIQPDTDISTEIFFTNLYEGYDESFFTDKEISCKSVLNDNTITITITALQSKTDKNKTIAIYDYIGNVIGTIELKQKGRIINYPISEAPQLGETAKKIVTAIATNIAEGLRDYNLIEQYYAHNKAINTVKLYVHPDNDKINSAWSKLYNANIQLLQLKQADEIRLNVYADYCNVISALLYSNLIYGWGDVPYINNYSYLKEHIITQGGAPRESALNIFTNLKTNLSKAIDHLPEKKNEPLIDANGFFFASKDVARVLLANIYMYEGNYSDAQLLLQKVISNGFYSLDASTNFKPSTSTNDIGIKESSEVIFALLNDAGTRVGITIMEAGVLPYITLSDVYLSLAECLCELENPTTAEQYIKDVIKAKNLNIASGTNTLMKIKEVREQILLHSGTYFAFLKRTGIAKDVCEIEDYQLLFPIPSQELFSNKYMTPNPGY